MKHRIAIGTARRELVPAQGKMNCRPCWSGIGSIGFDPESTPAVAEINGVPSSNSVSHAAEQTREDARLLALRIGFGVRDLFLHRAVTIDPRETLHMLVGMRFERRDESE